MLERRMDTGSAGYLACPAICHSDIDSAP